MAIFLPAFSEAIRISFCDFSRSSADDYFVAVSSSRTLEAALSKVDMKLNVLIVDDSAAIRKILLRTLCQTELPVAEIHEASDGLEAITALETRHVNLILSDLNMPNMDGLELLTKVKESPKWKNLPFILVTREGSQAKVLQAAKLGANGYVRKPFTSEQIKEKVLSCVKGAGA